MKITVKKLMELGACQDSIEAFPAKWGKEVDSLVLLKSLRDRGNFDWANWLIVRVMTRPQYLAYAIYAAEEVLDIYEKKFPNDHRPRQAIKAAREVLKHDNKKNRAAAEDAAWVASGVAWTAWVASGVAWAAWEKLQIKILNYGIKLLED
jgi:hypothetical protein